MVARTCQPFLALKELILAYSPEVPPAYIFEEGSMPNIETLVMKFGDQGKEIFGVENLTSPKEVQYSGCDAEKMKNHPYLSGKMTAIQGWRQGGGQGPWPPLMLV